MIYSPEFFSLTNPQWGGQRFTGNENEATVIKFFLLPLAVAQILSFIKMCHSVT
jgi:hypothetical protein